MSLLRRGDKLTDYERGLLDAQYLCEMVVDQFKALAEFEESDHQYADAQRALGAERCVGKIRARLIELEGREGVFSETKRSLVRRLAKPEHAPECRCEKCRKGLELEPVQEAR